MWHIFTFLTNFSIHTIQPLERWKGTIVIILEKNRDSPKLNQLCVIKKYEVDHSLLLKLYQKQLTTQQVEQEETLGKSQLRTRPNKS